jgi:hypothetical protein
MAGQRQPAAGWLIVKSRVYGDRDRENFAVLYDSQHHAVVEFGEFEISAMTAARSPDNEGL